MDEEKVVETHEAPIKKTNWVLPITVVLIAGIVIFIFSNRSHKSDEQNDVKAIQTTVSAVVPESGMISVEGGMFYFKPNEIRVKKNQTVKLTFTNKEGMHDFVMDKFNAKTKRIKAGESETIEFTPDEIGEFEFYCSVGNHRAQGMFGKLIVEE